jgi:hypothetical protein
MEIKYLSGIDVREPQGEGRKIIGHCCNDLGRMGAGVAKALMDKWPAVRSDYVQWHKNNNHNGHPFALGKVQFVSVEDEIAVGNIIGQHGLRVEKGQVPVRYSALRDGCNYIRRACLHFGASAHFPYLMGCDLAGGKWYEVEQILKEELIQHGVEVTCYDLFNKLKGIDDILAVD